MFCCLLLSSAVFSFDVFRNDLKLALRRTRGKGQRNVKKDGEGKRMEDGRRRKNQGDDRSKNNNEER
jgi:hypothetical protein